MKIITLNTWAGRGGKEALLEFFRAHKDTVDIFCLQEIWSAPHNHLEGMKAGGREIKNAEIMVYGLQDISALLTDFVPYFRPQSGDHYGLLLLVRKGIEVKDEGAIYVYKDQDYVPTGDMGNHARRIQFVTVEHNGAPLTVVNFHGIWNGMGKTDTEDRLNQSKNIIKFTEDRDGHVALCGDFNLLPETESIKLLEGAGLRNLVTESGVTSTRTSFYTKPEKFADYIFVSPELKVNDFKVLPDEVSDHAPLYIEIV